MRYCDSRECGTIRGHALDLIFGLIQLTPAHRVDGLRTLRGGFIILLNFLPFSFVLALSLLLLSHYKHIRFSDDYDLSSPSPL